MSHRIAPALVALHVVLVPIIGCDRLKAEPEDEPVSKYAPTGIWQCDELIRLGEECAGKHPEMRPSFERVRDTFTNWAQKARREGREEENREGLGKSCEVQRDLMGKDFPFEDCKLRR